MARTASPLTVAIRSLLTETKGGITHADSRARLLTMGLPVAAEPTAKSETYKTWLAHVGKVPVPKDDAERLAFYKKTAKEAGIKPALVDELMREDAVNRAFIAERNNFDVTKYNWNQDTSSVPSTKPETSKNSKAKVAAKTGNTVGGKVVTMRKAKYAPAAAAVAPKRGRPSNASKEAASAINTLEAVGFVLENGGVEGVQKRVAELQAEMDKLNNMLQAVASVGKMLAA